MFDYMLTGALPEKIGETTQDDFLKSAAEITDSAVDEGASAMRAKC